MNKRINFIESEALIRSAYLYVSISNEAIIKNKSLGIRL